MARKELKEAKAIDEANVSLVKQDLGASIQYLLEMERMFDHDTRRLFELVRVHLDSVLADRQNDLIRRASLVVGPAERTVQYRVKNLRLGQLRVDLFAHHIDRFAIARVDLRQ